MKNNRDDILRYVRGEMTPEERQALERAAQDDPFLQDALEGSTLLDPDCLTKDVQALDRAIAERVAPIKKRSIIWWPWATAASVLLLVSALVWWNTRSLEKPQSQTNEVTPETETTVSKPDGSVDLKKLTLLDTLPLAIHSLKTRPPVVQKPTRGGPIIPQTVDSQPAVNHAHGVDQITSGEQDLETKELVEIAAADVAEELKKNKLEEDKISKPNTNRVHRQTKIKGLILDQDNLPLIGGTISAENTDVGTFTDVDGGFELIVNLPVKLKITFTGFLAQDVLVTDTNLIKIIMTEGATLAEVVVTGYDERAVTQEFPVMIRARPQSGRTFYKKYLLEQMQYPRQALDANVEGRVTVQFHVDVRGALHEFKVIKGLGYGCDDELIRLIKTGPLWHPRKRGGIVEEDVIRISMRFKLPK